jgi:hypothetical protein
MQAVEVVAARSPAVRSTRGGLSLLREADDALEGLLAQQLGTRTGALHEALIGQQTTLSGRVVLTKG